MINKIERLVNCKEFLERMSITGSIEVSEIRKGKVNHIFRITDVDKGVSYILKKSETKLAGLNLPIVSSFDISTSRNHNEAKVLRYIAEIISAMYVPKVLLECEEESFFVMEFLDGYEDVRDVLLNMHVPNNLGESLSSILADIYLKTANATEEEMGVKNRCMLDVIIMLLIKIPYEEKMVKANKILVDSDFFTKAVKDKELMTYVMELAYKLKNSKQALLNGDLHLGSIFYKQGKYKLYDYEFAFKGPVSYEIGKIIAHFILAYYYALAEGANDVAEDVLKQIIIFYDSIFCELEKNDAFSYPRIKDDVLKFCGLELISRVTGILQLKYIMNISDSAIRDKVQKCVFKLGEEMIKGRFKINSGKEFVSYVQK